MVAREGGEPSFAFKLGPLACFCLHTGEDSPGHSGYSRRTALAKDGSLHSPDSAGFVGEVCCDGDIIKLEQDCYSMAAVKGMAPIPAVLLPFVCALVQFFVLYFFAFSKENLFDEGQWLEPISRTSMSVNFMKVVSFMMVLFKISTELQHAQKLCHALSVGEFEHPHSQASGCWALVLQYAMALSVLFSAISVVLAAQSCTSCLLKIFSVFVVVDMDNLAGKFIISLSPFDFSVPVSPEHAADHHVHRKKGDTYRRMCFLVLPIALSIIMAFLAVSTNTVPLSWVKYGRISNSGSPQMLLRGDGCCPPQVMDSTGNSANYSVLLLGELPQNQQYDPDVPRVFWVAIAGNHRAPSPLQIMDGRDGDDNFAFQAGHVDAEHVQAKEWLQRFHYDAHQYYALRDEEQLNLRTLPYTATFALCGLQLYGITYLVYVAAQNPRTLALTPKPAVADHFVTTVCAEGCQDCKESGPGRCDTCSEGRYLTDTGICLTCPQSCLRCSNSDTCRKEGCQNGFGVDSEGQCQECRVGNCKSCYANVSTCQQCEDGFGQARNLTCVRCAHPRCDCSTEGGCDKCDEGWGLTENHTWCEECQHGCKDCHRSGDHHCQGCQEGYGPDGTRCRKCIRHCLRCNSTVEGCDECRTGFGYDQITEECQPCKVDHCEKCDGAGRCQQCQHGWGVTPRGACDTCGFYCRKCGSASACIDCQHGYVLQDGQCWTCADRCAECTQAGRARCDRCLPGFMLDNSTKTCVRERAQAVEI